MYRIEVQVCFVTVCYNTVFALVQNVPRNITSHVPSQHSTGLTERAEILGGMYSGWDAIVGWVYYFVCSAEIRFG